VSSARYLQQEPRRVGVLRVRRDPHYIAADQAGAVQVGLVVDDRERRRRVVHVRTVVGDERVAPFAVQRHRDLFRLEPWRSTTRSRPAELGEELLELVVAIGAVDIVDELLLPLQEARPGRIRRERRVSVRVVPLPPL
jgi:hypothetical protein